MKKYFLNGGAQLKIVFMVICLSIIMMLSACAVKVFDTTSQLDKMRTVGYDAFDYCEYKKIAYALAWKSSMPENTVFFEVLLNGNSTPAKGKSLDIFIDGKKFSYSNINDRSVEKDNIVRRDLLTGKASNIEEKYQTKIMYRISRTLINQMIDAKSIGLRISLSNDAIIEDVIENKAPIISFMETLQIKKDA